jgi:predicted RNase H-like HicB family nuclease
MKQYVFPAVVYVDDETGLYVLSIKDTLTVIEGDNIEELFFAAKETLKEYVKAALEFDGDVMTPSKFIDVYKKYKTEICLLIDCEI